MATLRNDTVVRSADGQGTSAIVTATNIGTYGVAANSTYYVGTTQNIFNRASGAQTLTGVSIDGNAANITAYTIALFSHKTDHKVDFEMLWGKQQVPEDMMDYLMEN